MLKSTSNFVKAFMCLVVLVCSAQTFAQSLTKSITIYDGTAQNEDVPFYFYYGDTKGTKSQIIYPAEDLAELNGRNIAGIKFYNAGYSKDWSGNLVVSVFEGDYKKIEEYTDDYFGASYITTNFKEVFNGEVSLTKSDGDSFLEFTFDEPYAYTGKNLVIDITNTTTSSYQEVYFYGTKISYNAGVHGYSGSASSYHEFLPKATFSYELSYDELPEYGATVSIDNIDFGTLFTNKEATQEIRITNTGKNDITATITGVEAPFSVPATSIELVSAASATIPVTFAPTIAGEHSGTITIDLGEAGSYDVVVSGNAMDAPTGYVQEFNVENKTLPQGWTGWVIKDSYDFDIYEYVYESAETNTDYFVGTEIAGKKGVTIQDYSNPYKEYPSQYTIYMVSPLVRGNVLFSAIGTNSSAYITPEISAYKVSSDENGAYVIDNEPIEIIWQTPLTNTDWSYAIFTLDEPTQIAFFMNYGAISMFACDAEGQTTGINNIAADNNTNCVLSGEDLTINSSANLVAYQVTSISGATIACGNIEGNAADVKLNIPTGVYVITITSENGTSVHKLLKK